MFVYLLPISPKLALSALSIIFSMRWVPMGFCTWAPNMQSSSGWWRRRVWASTDPSLSYSPQKRSKLHYHIAVIINYLGHCVSLGALLVAFVLFMRLR